MDDLQKPDAKCNKQDSENYMGHDPINRKCAEDANAERERDREQAAHCSLAGLREGDGLDHQEGMRHFPLGMMTVFKNQMEGVEAA